MDEPTLRTADGLTLCADHHRALGRHRGTVLLAHGITQDMDEGGSFRRLADCLTDAGFDVVRFTYRGHGESDGTPEGVTVAGERLDIQAAYEHTTARFDGPYFLLAKSFGAVSTCLSLDRFDGVAGVVLWSPVLDVEATFLEPTAPWGVERFTGESLAELRTTGSTEIEDGFRMSRLLYEELQRYDPAAALAESETPALVVHGTGDGIVPYEPTRRAAEAAGADLHTIEDADHGFVRPGEQPPFDADAREQDRRTVAWLTDRTDG